MAEICSTYPTAGGLYYWSAKLSGPGWGPWMAWITGWFDIIALHISGASSGLTVATLVVSAIQIYHPDYKSSAGAEYAIACGLAFIGAMSNSLGERFLRYCTYTALVGIASGLFVFGIPLLALSPAKATAAQTWGSFVDQTGWDNKAIAFQLSFLMPIWCESLQEETVDSATAPSRSIIVSLAASQILGYAFILILNYSITDVDAVLNCRYKQSLVCVFEQGTGGNKEVTMFLTIYMILQYIWNIQAGHNGGSRALYAWARDGAIPKWFHWVHPKTKQPIRAIWVHAFVTWILVSAHFGSSVAVSAFASFSTVGTYIAYTLPTICKVVWARDTFKQSGFNLGRYSLLINYIAIIFMVYVVILLCLPQLMPVTVENLNFTPIMLVGVSLLISVYWIWAKFWFVGPRVHVSAEEAEEMARTQIVLETKKDPSIGL
ncbi:hypothetical protein HDU93_007790 [Gonapodya sp. JEL0774]|nr:hypothetical protein HDU93_007790 [Gonapodya sp. JEL0774]